MCNGGVTLAQVEFFLSAFWRQAVAAIWSNNNIAASQGRNRREFCSPIAWCFNFVNQTAPFAGQ